MATEKKILVSGIKPTGRIHIGNYFGAIRQFVNLQDTYDSTIFIADYHALTTLHNPKELSENILNIATDYLAAGLDETKITLFKQSDVPQHTELAWVFNCITTMPYLMRAHAFKDAEARNKEISAGVFGYPLLMAADILIHSADVVPVGQDQKQHIEIARDTALKFNRIFGETFTTPEPHILDTVATVPGTDGKKMSKSYNNTIPLFAEDDEVRNIVSSIVTDSKNVGDPKDPDTDNVFALHKLFSEDTLEELHTRYTEGTIGYKESKELLAENIIRFITPMRDKRAALKDDPKRIQGILLEGAERAGNRAREKMADVKARIGVTLS